jgi:alpha-mannosidase
VQIQTAAAQFNRNNFLFFGSIAEEQTPYTFCRVRGGTVSALKPAEDGNGIILRLWNGMDSEQKAEVAFPDMTVTAVEETRLDETPVSGNPGITHTSDGFSIKLPPKKIQTLRIKTK